MKLREEPDKSLGKAKKLFAELYETNLTKVYRYIYYRVGDVTVAEDLTSAVFEKAFTKFDSYRSDKASFSTWLFSITRHTVIDHYRKARHVSAIALNPHSSGGSGIDEAVKWEELQKLLFCLSQLSELEQEIISLKFGSGLPNREIAELKQLSESNVGTILYRAIRKLRDTFLEGEKNE